MFNSFLSSVVFHTVKTASIVVHGTGVACQKSATGLRITADHLDKGAEQCFKQEKALIEKAITIASK